jgi:hypothetical protein
MAKAIKNSLLPVLHESGSPDDSTKLFVTEKRVGQTREREVKRKPEAALYRAASGADYYRFVPAFGLRAVLFACDFVFFSVLFLSSFSTAARMTFISTL